MHSFGTVAMKGAPGSRHCHCIVPTKYTHTFNNNNNNHNIDMLYLCLLLSLYMSFAVAVFSITRRMLLSNVSGSWVFCVCVCVVRVGKCDTLALHFFDCICCLFIRACCVRVCINMLHAVSIYRSLSYTYCHHTDCRLGHDHHRPCWLIVVADVRAHNETTVARFRCAWIVNWKGLRSIIIKYLFSWFVCWLLLVGYFIRSFNLPTDVTVWTQTRAHKQSLAH